MEIMAVADQKFADSLTLHVIDISVLQSRRDCLALPFARWFIWQLLRSREPYGFTLGGSLLPASVVAGLLELTDERLLQRCCQMITQSRGYARLDRTDGLDIALPRDLYYYHFGCENETRVPEQAVKVLVTASAVPVVCPELPDANPRARTIAFEQAVASASGILATTRRSREDLRLFCGAPQRKFLPLTRPDRAKAGPDREPAKSPYERVTLVCSPGLSGQLAALTSLTPSDTCPRMELRIFGGSAQLHEQLRHAQRTHQLDGIDILTRSDWSPAEIEHALQTSCAVILLSYYDELEFLEPYARAYGANVLSLSVEVSRNGQVAATFSRTERHDITLSEWLIESRSIEDQRNRAQAAVGLSQASTSAIEAFIGGNVLRTGT
jgi:hypothetical protein